jgi:hypothetical protein
MFPLFDSQHYRQVTGLQRLILLRVKIIGRPTAQAYRFGFLHSRATYAGTLARRYLSGWRSNVCLQPPQQK